MKRRISPNEMNWFHAPSLYVVSGDKLILETEPYTTFQAAKNGSHDAFGKYLDTARNFSFTIRMNYQFQLEEDGCGIFLQNEEGNWCSFGLEKRVDDLDLACTVSESCYKDRSLRELGSGITWLYLRVIYWEGNVRFQYSFHGERYSDMRWFHFNTSDSKVRFGIYACSPRNSFFDVTFEEMEFQDF